MMLFRASLLSIAICVVSQPSSAEADGVVSLKAPRLTLPAALRLNLIPESGLQFHGGALTQTLPSDHDVNVERAGRGRILIAAGVPMLVFGTPLVAWAASAEGCYNPDDDLGGSVIAGGVLAGTGLVLTSAGIQQLVKARRKARRAPTPARFRHWAIPIGFASALLSMGTFLTGFIGGSIGCYSS